MPAPHGTEAGIGDTTHARTGDLTWDPVKFPDPKAMIDELHSLGCRVTLWVMPFVNPDAAAFTVGTREGALPSHYSHT